MKRFLVFVFLLAAHSHGSSSLDLARQLNEAFVQAAEKVSPSVVVITVVQKQEKVEQDELEFWNSLPQEFRKRFHDRNDSKSEPNRGQGSGVIIRKDGFILTNGHVVEDAEKIEVRLQDGRSYKATVRGVDSQSDVAVIKIEANDLPVAKLADSSQTRVGEFAIAIGAPFNLDHSVTFGHVSAKGRSGVLYDPTMDQDFIQTDANINPGNSGGPLVNINGEVIGINTLIRGMHTGIGFAVPSNRAKEVAEELINNGKFARAWLGIGIVSLRELESYREFVSGISDGVVVRSKLPSGPAWKSDLKPSDVITAVNGRSVATPQQLRDEIRGKKIGGDVTLDVFRNGKMMKVKVQPGEWMAKSESQTNLIEVQRIVTKTATTNNPGLTVQSLTRELADQFNVEFGNGVIVTTVDKNSLAARNEIKPGEVITEINHREVKDPKAFREAIKAADFKKGVVINLISSETSRFEILREE
jgi:serine protease Do